MTTQIAVTVHEKHFAWLDNCLLYENTRVGGPQEEAERHNSENSSDYQSHCADLDQLSGKLAPDPLAFPDPVKDVPRSYRVAHYANQENTDGLQFLSLVSKLRADKEMRVGEVKI